MQHRARRLQGQGLGATMVQLQSVNDAMHAHFYGSATAGTSKALFRRSRGCKWKGGSDWTISVTQVILHITTIILEDYFCAQFKLTGGSPHGMGILVVQSGITLDETRYHNILHRHFFCWQRIKIRRAHDALKEKYRAPFSYYFVLALLNYLSRQSAEYIHFHCRTGMLQACYKDRLPHEYMRKGSSTVKGPGSKPHSWKGTIHEFCK